MNVLKIFIDEAGYTGNNLLDEHQPYFSCALVTIDESNAKQIIKNLKNKYFIQSNELKAKNLLKTNKGKDSCQEIINQIGTNGKVIILDKKFNLCCQFFEYLFEPIVSKNCGLFYYSNFHKYIANSLYFMDFNQEFLAAFQSFIRNYKEGLCFDKLLAYKKTTPFLDKILYIVEMHIPILSERFDALKQNNDYISTHLLDLTLSAIYALCSEFCSKSQKIEIVCDESKMLNTFVSEFNQFVNKDQEKIITFPNLEEGNIILNLSDSIKTAKSHSNSSIQLADILAGVTNYSFANRSELFSKTILVDLLDNGLLCRMSVVPDEKFMSNKGLKTEYDNTLDELYMNVKEGRPIVTDSIRDKLESLYYSYRAYLLSY